MSIHRLSANQFIARPIEELFGFFSRPENLGRITPSSMGFELITDDLVMRESLEIRYRIRPLLGVPMTWVTRITDYEAPTRFRDLQLSGPYARWEHTHTFEAVPGGTIVRDEIAYKVPLGPLGDLANRVFVRAELGGPETLRMRDIIAAALRVAGLSRPIVPGPTPLIKLLAIPLSWLPTPILTPDAVDFIDQPATVDVAPLLERMPRRLTPLEEGLRMYLGPPGDDATLAFDTGSTACSQARPPAPDKSRGRRAPGPIGGRASEPLSHSQRPERNP